MLLIVPRDGGLCIPSLLCLNASPAHWVLPLVRAAFTRELLLWQVQCPQVWQGPSCPPLPWGLPCPPLTRGRDPGAGSESFPSPLGSHLASLLRAFTHRLLFSLCSVKQRCLNEQKRRRQRATKKISIFIGSFVICFGPYIITRLVSPAGVGDLPGPVCPLMPRCPGGGGRQRRPTDYSFLGCQNLTQGWF